MKQILHTIALVILLTCGLSAVPQSCFAQAIPDSSLNNIIDDTLRQRKPAPDTSAHTNVISTADATPLLAAKKGPFQPNPKKSGLYSALFPGLGQIYNRQYWKLPIVYVGVAAVGYYYIKNLNDYQSYRKAYIGRINNNHPTDEYVGRFGDPELKQKQDESKKYLDLTVLLGAIGYTLQVLDAVTAAHLKNFDISRDISMRFVPVVTPQGVGLGLAVKF